MGLIVFLILAVLAVIVLGGLVKFSVGLLIALLVWMLAGMFAGRLLRGRGYGPLGDILLGLIGGAVGSFVLRLVGLGWVDNIVLVGDVLVGVIGAVIVVYLVRLIGNKRFAS
ncbi:MAG TPA: hypothetical protein VHO69_01920 [Phototrophicaceae bacterium]|nr:hypothetical protein [Phototrophicaceae bacterium]